MKLRDLATVTLSVGLLAAFLFPGIWYVNTAVHSEVPPPGWVAPVEQRPVTGHSNWLRFEEAVVRRDTKEVDHWIGQHVAFVVESRMSADQSLVAVRRIYEDDTDWTKLTAEVSEAARSEDRTKIRARVAALEAYDRKFPRMTCQLPLASAKVIFRYEFGFTTFQMEGIIRKVDLKANRIWVDPLSFMPGPVSS